VDKLDEAQDRPTDRGYGTLRQLLKAEQVAVLFGLPKSTVFDYARRGVLPCVRIGRRVRFRPQDIERFMDAGGKALPGGWREEPIAQ
jgi:excisionase family DNA binding protein